MKINDIIFQAYILAALLGVFSPHLNVICPIPLGRQCHLKYAPTCRQTGCAIHSIQTEGFCCPILKLFILITSQFSSYIYTVFVNVIHSAVLRHKSLQFVQRERSLYRKERKRLV